jgi:hypothetical protein
MNLRDYFTEKVGVGVISTSNKRGEVNSAVYAKPHVTGTHTVAFIMRDRLTRANLLENDKANYLFIEHDQGFKGIRISLTRSEEVQDKELIQSLSRRNITEDDTEVRFLVTFTVDKALTLIGGEELEIH